MGVLLTYGDGSTFIRNTFFDFKSGEWKRRFSQEEDDLVILTLPTRSSVGPNRTCERGIRRHDYYHRDRLVRILNRRSPRSWGSLRG
jgi:hypothetical protein